jgi:hypothetical protein
MALHESFGLALAAAPRNRDTRCAISVNEQTITPRSNAAPVKNWNATSGNFDELRVFQRTRRPIELKLTKVHGAQRSERLFASQGH